jgi:hypothetical protein
MANTTPADPQNPYGYVGKNEEELRKLIVDLVRQNEDLKVDKKEFVKSANEVLKENSTRISHALEAIKNVARNSLEDEADKILKVV